MKCCSSNSSFRIWAVARNCLLELYRRKDVYVALIIALLIVVPLSGTTIFGFSGISRYLAEVSLLLIWLFSFIIALTTATRQFPTEFLARTIQPLVAKPISRSEIVLGKLFGTHLAVSSALLLFYGLFVLLNGIKQDQWFTATLFQAFILHNVFCLITAAMAIMASMWMTPAAASTCSGIIIIGMLLFGVRLPELATGSKFAEITIGIIKPILPHTEFFDMRTRLIHAHGAIPWTTFAIVIIYGICYTTALTAIACAIFRRKQL